MVTAFCLVQLTSDLCARVAFEWATVGNKGNAADTKVMSDGTTGYGSVSYAYRISKHEVTNAQYIEFLNAVAAVGDTYHLYHQSMMISIRGGIDRTGAGTVGDPYVYSVKGSDNNWLNRPVNFVSWGSSARFTNWLHNGQPTGPQDSTTTEDGAYFLNGATSNSALLTVSRESDATYFIPSEDEWYKAAYHKNDGVTGNYFDYPTSSDIVPSYVNNSGNLSRTGIPFVEGGTDTRNYATHDEDFGTAGIGSPYYMTEVGEWENSASPYGTFDQGGNVWEWNEAVRFARYRGRRGGSFDNDAFNLRAVSREDFSPRFGISINGFRVASIPEPSTLSLAALALLGSVGYMTWKQMRA